MAVTVRRHWRNSSSSTATCRQRIRFLQAVGDSISTSPIRKRDLCAILLGHGLDIRGGGGYVVAPPSLHHSGKRYTWVMNGQADPAPLPEWLRNLICEYPAPKQVPSNGTGKIREGERNVKLTSFAGSMRRRGMSKKSIELALLAENEARCEPPLPEHEIRRIAFSISKYQPEPNRSAAIAVADESPTAADAWPNPAPLGEELPPVPPLELEFLPSSLRPLIEDVSERMQAPIEYAAAAAVVSLAGCVGRRAAIMPKVEDTGWRVVPNLWGAIIAPPGFMKSPMLSAITLPLRDIEDKWRAEHQSDRENFELEKEQAELRHQAWKEDFKRSIKLRKEPPVQADQTPSQPTQRRLILTDATFEKLHEILAENPAGIFVVRDELTGWLSELDRVGREGERGFFLQSWNGDAGFTVDRIGRGSIHVPAVCVSLLGNIQPARLRWYLAQALEGGPSDDGLFQRFQIMVWPDPPRDWHLVDRPANQNALRTAEHVFSQLAELSSEEPLLMRFAPDAQELFFAWWADLEKKIRASVGVSPVLIAHLAKYRSLMPSLAGLFQLADSIAHKPVGGAHSITLEEARRAAAWCEFLQAHAQRVYACAISPEFRAAHELARHLRGGGLPFPFTTRAVYLKGWTGLGTPDHVRAALELLQELGWVCQVPVERDAKGGRPSEVWLINPKVGGR